MHSGPFRVGCFFGVFFFLTLFRRAIYKFLLEEPTFKCVTKLGHCISVIPFQNAISFIKTSPKYSYFIFFSYIPEAVIFSMLIRTIVFFISY